MTDVGETSHGPLGDRYDIERELGQGGMATVYLAEDLKHKRKVALKVLKPERAAVLGAERFVQEIMYDIAPDDQHLLMIMSPASASGSLVLVLNWLSDLRRGVRGDRG